MDHEKAAVTPLGLPRTLYTSCLSTKAKQDELSAILCAVNEGLDSNEPPSLLSEYLQELMNLLRGLDTGNSSLVAQSGAELISLTNAVQANERKYARNSRL